MKEKLLEKLLDVLAKEELEQRSKMYNIKLLYRRWYGMRMETRTFVLTAKRNS